MRQKTVLITRPHQQAQSLAEAIERLGGRTIILPMIKIVAKNPRQKLAELTKRSIQAQEKCIFTSANAVPVVAHLAESFFTKVIVIAIGQGTARALQQAHIRVDMIAQDQNSEGLLNLPILQQIANTRVTIFCGEDPRPLLKDSLMSRQAIVEEIFCYQRQLIHYTPAECNAALKQTDYIVITSLQSLNHFVASLEQISSDFFSMCQACPLVASSENIALAARARGFTVMRALDASDTAILKVLLEHIMTANS